MNYLDTAFAQLGFVIKLMHYAEQDRLNLDEIDIPLTVDEGTGLLVLPNRIFDSPSDCILACQNLVSVSFGAAAITLNRAREEYGVPLPNPISSEQDQCIALVYQIRNAFAHDISEPRWELRGQRYKRRYRIENIAADLTGLDGQRFSYAHIGGAESLFLMKQYAESRLFFHHS